MLIKSTNDTPTETGVGTVWFTGNRKLTHRERSMFYGRLKDWPLWCSLIASVAISGLAWLLMGVATTAWFVSLDRATQSALAVIFIVFGVLILFATWILFIERPSSRRRAVEEIRRGDWQDRGFVHESQPMFCLVKRLLIESNIGDTAFVDRLNKFFTASAPADCKLRRGTVDSAKRYVAFSQLVEDLFQAAQTSFGGDSCTEYGMLAWRDGYLEQAKESIQQALDDGEQEIARLQDERTQIQAKLTDSTVS